MAVNRVQRESGMALVLTMGILLLVTLMALGFFASQHIEKKASSNYRDGVIAEELADGAVQKAIALLIQDLNANSESNEFKAYDSLVEVWGPKYDGNDERRFSYRNGDLGKDLDPAITSPDGDDEDVRRIEILDDDGRPIGCIYVLVMPENSKVNINTAGRLEPGTLGTNAFDGYTPYAVNLAHLLQALPSSPFSEEHTERLLKWRFCGRPDAPGSILGPGADDTDDWGDNGYFELDKIDNDSDGEIDEAGEGVDDPLEYFYIPGTPNYEALYANDFLCVDPKMICLSWSDGDNNWVYENGGDDVSLASYLTTFSYENDLLDFDGNERVRINKHAFPYQKAGGDADAANKQTLATEIKDALVASGMPDATAAQLAVNIVDYSDYDYSGSNIRADVRTQLDSGDPDEPYLGVEKTVYIIEANGASYVNPAGNPFLTRDADNDFIELINISGRQIDLNGWTVEVGGATANLSGTIDAWSGWGGTQHFMILAVEKGPDPWDGINPAVNSGNGYYTNNGHSFVDDIGGVPDAQIVEVSGIGNAFQGNTRIRLFDNNGNLVDVMDPNDTRDGLNQWTSWQKDDPTVDSGVASDQTAGNTNSNDSHPADGSAIWLDPTGTGEVKHVKDRYFSSVAELAKVTGSAGPWQAFVPRYSIAGITPQFEALLKAFDKFTIAQELAGSDLAGSVEGTAVNVPQKFAIGSHITPVVPGSTGDQALVRGRININATFDRKQEYVYNALRIPLDPQQNMAAFFNNVLWRKFNTDGADGFGGDPNYPGLGGFRQIGTMRIDDFMAVSNLLTTKSNVFKIIVLAQAYDRTFGIAAERKLEVIVDRGYRTDASGYSDEAKGRARQVRVLSYRWITEEE